MRYEENVRKIHDSDDYDEIPPFWTHRWMLRVYENEQLIFESDGGGYSEEDARARLARARQEFEQRT